MGRWRAVRGRLLTDETALRATLQIWSSRVSNCESSKRVKCLLMRKPKIARILRDSVRRKVERALMRDVVVPLRSCRCLVYVRVIFSSTPRTR
jgi:hypothetical protein